MIRIVPVSVMARMVARRFIGISGTVNCSTRKADRVGKKMFGVLIAKRTPLTYAIGFQLSKVTPYDHVVVPDAVSMPYNNPADMKSTESLTARRFQSTGRHTEISSGSYSQGKE